jgi:hypothetical protein
MTWEVPLVRLEGFNRREKRDGTIVYTKRPASPIRDYSRETSRGAFKCMCEHLPAGISRQDLESRTVEYTDSDTSDESTTPPGRVKNCAMHKNGVSPTRINITPGKRDIAMEDFAESAMAKWLTQLPKYD